MSEQEANPSSLERRLACDNCRIRKTKCDKNIPCASCVTLRVTCHTSRRPQEKKQRVLLSTKYDEAVQDVNRQLIDVKEMLQTLLLNSNNNNYAASTANTSAPSAPSGPASALTSRAASMGPAPTAGGHHHYHHHQQERTPPRESLPTSATTRSIINEQIPSLTDNHDSYLGDSSFHSHAERVNRALEATLATSRFAAGALAPPPPPPPARNDGSLHADWVMHRRLPHVANMAAGSPPEGHPMKSMSSTHQQQASGGTGIGNGGTGGGESNRNVNGNGGAATCGEPPMPYNPDFGNMPLPPVDSVLRILRLAKVEQQRFFIDVPLYDEEEFHDMCRAVYFATEHISIWLWINVNVGLCYLFLYVTESSCERMGTTPAEFHAHLGLLKANAEAAMQSVRLCSDPTFESCRSLALLATFYVKEGHTVVGWRLMSGAARAALDLGMHRLTSADNDAKSQRIKTVFGHIYVWDKGLSITTGRTPVIPHYDVVPASIENLPERTSVRGRLYNAFGDCAIIVAQIQQDLFSVLAQQATQHVRSQRARKFAAQLLCIRKSVESISPEDATWLDMYAAVADTLDIMTSSLMTLVYRVLPPVVNQPHPLQCADECVDSARASLTTFVRVGKSLYQKSPNGWATMVHWLLSLVPFVSFLVLTGNAIANSSDQDLELLSSTVMLLASASESSPTVQKMHDACNRFAQIARLIVATAVNNHQSQEQAAHGMVAPQQYPGATAGVPGATTAMMVDDYGLPMPHQGWEDIMVDFEAEMGAYDSRALTSIMEPYMTHQGW